jgi:hypothetical protein
MAICFKKLHGIRRSKLISKKKKSGEFLYKLFEDLDLFMRQTYSTEI